MSKEQKLKTYNPSAVANTSNNIFGLPFDVNESKLVYIPAPWDVTVSNHPGTAGAPALLFEHSFQIDLYDSFLGEVWKAGMAMENIDGSVLAENKGLREHAATYIAFLESGGDPSEQEPMQALLKNVNQGTGKFCEQIKQKCTHYLENGQLPLIVGGDHSVSLGLIQALADRHNTFGILQIDAHADLRHNYQGFTHSHASVMRNALALPELAVLAQVGIREWCDEEAEYMENNERRIKLFSDRDLHQRLYLGTHWNSLCEEITDFLPDRVYVSFDVDGLTPSLCPHTGTPVPGGLNYNQALHLLETLVRKGKTIIGADLVETGAHPTDAMIGCRLLYKLGGLMLKSNS